MNITINKDFLTEYKDDFWKGFTFQECVSIAVGAAIGIGGAAAVHFYTGIAVDTAVYIGVPMAAPVVFLGFYKYQGYLQPIRFLNEVFITMRMKSLHYETGGLPERRYFEMERLTIRSQVKNENF